MICHNFESSNVELWSKDFSSKNYIISVTEKVSNTAIWLRSISRSRYIYNGDISFKNTIK